jgi:predicted TIM-barrel fold metal-dependent hydrolase
MEEAMNVISGPRREQATRVNPDPIDPRGRAYKVVDTDFHFIPDWADLRKYMKEPFKNELSAYPHVGGDYSPKYAIGIEGSGQETLGRAKTAADILRVIDQIGIETVIVAPGFQRAQSMFHQAMVTATAAAYNDFLIHEVLPVSPRIKAEIMINHRNPEAGAAEIRRVGAQPGFVSVFTEFGGNYEPIGTAKHDPIFAAAVEHDLVVTSHIGTFWQKMTPISEGTRTWTELVGISSVCISMAYVASMIMQGLFDKFPGLRVIIKEGGFWWLPEFMARADDYYLNHPGDIKLVERKLESDEKFLAKLPSEYFDSNIRFSSQPVCFPKNPEHFKMLMTLCRGEDWLLYSSDWPHCTFDPLNWVFNGAVSETGRRKILAENARNWIRRLA